MMPETRLVPLQVVHLVLYYNGMWICGRGAGAGAGGADIDIGIGIGIGTDADA